jgi:hypothetical protein
MIVRKGVLKNATDFKVFLYMLSKLAFAEKGSGDKKVGSKSTVTQADIAKALGIHAYTSLPFLIGQHAAFSHGGSQTR